MKMVVIPDRDEARTQAVKSVLENLGGTTVQLPPVVYLEDEDGGWKRHAAGRSIGQRRRSVVAATTGSALVDAVRLEIGGALWLPVSTPSMTAACEAAVSGGGQSVVPLATESVLEMAVESASELRLVAWFPKRFWNRHFGFPRLVARLAVIANRLRCIPVILPWPALVVVDRSHAEIESAWRETADAGSSTGPGSFVVLDASDVIGGLDPVGRIHDCLAAEEARQGGSLSSGAVPQPVHELPSGVRVGCWGPSLDVDRPGEGWVAAPCDTTLIGHSWQLGTGRADFETIHDTVDAGGAVNRSKPVLRVPGWVAGGARRGTPSGLLVDWIANSRDRGGRPLWVPNVDVEGVEFLLGLPGPIWVDGPAVPK